MNQDEIDLLNIPQIGFILTDNVNIDWLKNLKPQFFPDMIKFVINIETCHVAVGMQVHSSAESYLGESGHLYGGNIYWDGSIKYTSTLNIRHNIEKKKVKPGQDPRNILDEEMIKMIYSKLSDWIEGI